MRDYWLTELFLRAVGWGYASLVLIAIGLALWLPRRWAVKAACTSIVLLVAAIPIYWSQQKVAEITPEVAAFKQRQSQAEALFSERCKSAGEKITRTVDGVTGIHLVNLRKPSDTMKQYEMNDPAGDGASGEGYVQTFLMGRTKSDKHPFLLTYDDRRGAYQYVESPSDSGEGVIKLSAQRVASEDGSGKLVFKREQAKIRSARYGIEWTDISTPEDRNSWIAGSRIRITDLSTNEVLAERVGYIFDKALGSTAGQRQPWAFAKRNACPEFPLLHGQYPSAWGLTRNFSEKVLKPKKLED